MRTVLLSVVCLAFLVTLVGCGGTSNAPVNAMGTVKAYQAVDKKGKAQKVIEADVPDTGGKK
jgi:predicted small lipoprotein YifL